MIKLEGPSSKKHGTRACYTMGCRCAPCTAANRDRWRKKQKELLEQEGDLEPSGPPIPGTMIRAGKAYQVLRCPGVGGKKCVVAGGAWLKGKPICGTCVLRATVWDGLVSSRKARNHLSRLSALGVGYKSVAAACNVGATAILKILTGKKHIRASTSKQILSVDAGALANGALVPAEEMNATVAHMLKFGFKKAELARLLGAKTKYPALQVGKSKRTTLGQLSVVNRLAKKIDRGDISPKAWGPPEDVKDLMRRGVAPPKLLDSPEAISHFLLELKELRDLRAQEVAPHKSQLEIINLSQFRDHV